MALILLFRPVRRWAAVLFIVASTLCPPPLDGHPLSPACPQLDDWFRKQTGSKRLVIATGFIAKNPQGQVRYLYLNLNDWYSQKEYPV